MAEENKKTDKNEVKGKVELSREYVIPLRRQVMKAQKYRRAKKAVRTIKEFLAKHMKVENRDLNKVKVNIYLNNEVWYRGIKNPPAKIKVKAEKRDGIVYVELAEIPDAVKWKMQKDQKFLKVDEKAMKEIAKREAEEKKEEKAETEDDKEKEKATVEAGQKEQKLEANQEKHTEKPHPIKEPRRRTNLQK